MGGREHDQTARATTVSSRPTACQPSSLAIRVHRRRAMPDDSRLRQPGSHQRGRLDPARLHVPDAPALRSASRPMPCSGSAARLQCRWFSGTSAARECGLPERRSSTPVPRQSSPSRNNVAALLQGGAHAAAAQARQQVVVGREMRCQQAHRQAGGARGRPGRGIQHRDLPAAPRQAGRDRRAGEPGADDDAAARRRPLPAGPLAPGFPGRMRTRACRQCRLGASPRPSRRRSRIAPGRAAPRRPPSRSPGARAAAAVPGDGLERVQVPHRRIALRVEAIEENRVGVKAAFAQRLLHVADDTA